MKSRSKTHHSSSSTAAAAASSMTKSSSFGSSSTTAAAVSVTKFGQATFTSVRHRQQDHHENGNFVPLKKTKYEHHDPVDDLIMMKMDRKSATSIRDGTNTNVGDGSNENKVAETKPKVYKFFKSRSSATTAAANTSSSQSSMTTGQQSNNSSSNSSRLSSSSSTTTTTTSSTNRSPSIVLNNFSNQKQQRITTYSGRIKATTTHNNNKNKNSNNNNNSIQTKSINITDNSKSCEIKICGDKTIKKVISPNKVTEFHIRINNSNVRNATVKPLQTTHTVQTLLSSEASRGIRSSRRLKGIEPEQVNNSQRSSSSIHFVYEKKSPNLTTTIEEIIEDDDDDDENQLQESVVEQQQQPEEQLNKLEESPKVTDESILKDQSETIINGEKNDQNSGDAKIVPSSPTPIVSAESDDYTQIKEKEKSDSIKSNEKNDDIQTETNSQNSQDSQKSNDQIPETIETTNIDLTDSQQQNDQSQPSSSSSITTMTVETKPDDEHQHQIAPAPVVVARPPKKKIFSNREHRNKIQFDAKKFFSSELKDEFDDEINKTAATTEQEKKPTDNDDNDDSYIKLKRIKKAHQCHELGETEQFDEDIKYYLSGIVSTNPNSMRCLSILGLTQQTMRPEFRMHLRAHDDMPRIIKALMDAPQDSNLALCTACLMFVYNQDRLTMDIDPNALSLMLELLETRSDECNQVEEKHRCKVRSLVEEMKNKGHAQYLKLAEITAGKLAMETLLGLTSKRAGDWFKVELRRMKGIDFIVNTVIRCAERHTEEGQIVKIDRCMHVLENVTFNNIENQLYIANYDESKFISTCIDLLIQFKQRIIESNESKVYLSAFFSILRVLTNLTSESVDGCKIVGKFDGIIQLLLESLFELPSFIMSDQRFDLMVIIICLCINLAAFCEHIRDIIMTSETRNYLGKLCDLLFKKIEEAAQVEQQTDHLLESHETVQMTEAMQDNLLMQMISKSGTHMEYSLLSACVCLLLGCCIQENNQHRKLLYDILPDHSFKPLIEQLKKLRDFAHLTDIMTQKGKERVQKVLQLFESCNTTMNQSSLIDTSIIDDDDVDDDDDPIASVPEIDDEGDDDNNDNDMNGTD
ncbi:cohesin release factor wings apart-like [Dermatophagoides farinae]|uniref:cohesin release factor wings apart-like n=1 Tax=Dermatophagoides farinae TaxID=6954 RepID=UPI003F61F480